MFLAQGAEQAKKKESPLQNTTNRCSTKHTHLFALAVTEVDILQEMEVHLTSHLTAKQADQASDNGYPIAQDCPHSGFSTIGKQMTHSKVNTK